MAGIEGTGTRPDLRAILSFEVWVDPPAVIDAAAGRRFVRITGGTVTGTFSGQVLASGGDWQLGRGGGVTELSAHYILDLEGHGLVEVSSEGIRRAEPGIIAALGRGELVDPSLYYFRTAIRFRTAAPGLDHLNGMVAIASGRRLPDRVILDVFEVT